MKNQETGTSKLLDELKSKHVALAGLGLVFGTMLGLLVGSAAGNMALGMVFGAIVGLMLGAAADWRRKNEGGKSER